jgi:hypothetical protein
MASSQFRVYFGPDDTMDEAPRRAGKRSRSVTVPLMDVLGPLADAFSNRRTWLHDFEKDEITISGDLYEVVLAYQYHCRSSA